MTRGPIVAAILEKVNAVEDFRTLIGATNPAEAAEGTIRNMFADSISENAVHGSDSDDDDCGCAHDILLITTRRTDRPAMGG